MSEVKSWDNDPVPHRFSAAARRRVIAFVVVTALALSVMACKYLGAPAALGLGRYEISVDLADASGLYPKSVVTLRGHAIGTVHTLDLRTGGGVRAVLSLHDDAKVPVGSIASVLSASAAGEQYLDLAPGAPSAGTDAYLRDGDRIAERDTRLPVGTSELLKTTDDLFRSLPRASLTTTINELGALFAGRGEDLGRLIDSTSTLQQAADANLDPTVRLIESLEPVLATQRSGRTDILGYANDLDSFTKRLVKSDEHLRDAIDQGTPFAEQTTQLFADLDEVTPGLLQDLAAIASVAKVYLPGIEHILTVFPAAIEAHYATYPADRRDDEYHEANLSFKVGIGSPPVCTTGFEDAGKHRSPDDLSPAPLPTNSYCKVGDDDVRVVRGARHNPCPNDPARHGATAAQCGLTFQRSSGGSR
jgi:phospholipid/cholesterol/gamma-HCH transport system substrate-binding protein